MLHLSPIARRNLLIVFMASAVIGSWILLDSERDTAVDQADQPATPDSYFTAMELTRFDSNGQPSIAVNAATARHYPGDPVIRLDEVAAEGRQADADWILTAETGELATERNHLHVERDVRLQQQRAKHPPMILSTRVLDIDADTEIVETTAPVKIRYGASEISGTGLWASLDEGRIIIESDVKARYEP